MSALLQTIAKRYRRGRAGKQAEATRDITFTFHDLFKQAGCLTGPARHEALRDLVALEAKNILHIKRHRTDPSEILEIRLPLQNEQIFFEHLGEVSPQEEREALASSFVNAICSIVPERFQAGWTRFCTELAEAARSGKSVQPFDRSNPKQAEQILMRLPQILSWQGESLLRFASVQIFGHSKLLEAYRPAIESCLSRITEGMIMQLSDLGILENERTFLLHGPLALRFDSRVVDFTPLQFPVRIETSDLRRAVFVTNAPRCLTVENAAMLKELAKLGSGTLLASSGSEGGYANSAVVDFLIRLPDEIEIWHFGDSDPKGFDILRDLRLRTKRNIRSLHMEFRPSEPLVPLSSEDVSTCERLLISELLSSEEKIEVQKLLTFGSKGAFEQESLGRPKPSWPFF